MAKGGKTEGAFLRRSVVYNGFLKLRISLLIGKRRFIHDRLPSFKLSGK
jgi:hypothetical protein